MQISTSARATLGNTYFSQACQLIGAVWYQTGLVDAAHALALLSEENPIPGKKSRPSFLTIYPSYLGQLVECGLAAGCRPSDFGLERISAGGEIVTAGYDLARPTDNAAVHLLAPMAGKGADDEAVLAGGGFLSS